MNRVFVTILLLTLFAPVCQLMAGGEGEKAVSSKQFGPYQALTFDASILRDVKYVPEEQNVYLQLFPDYKEKEIIVKLSHDSFANYREWAHGGYELVSPVNQGKVPYGRTDFVNTSANFIEYWMDGEVFLHLKCVK
ncbi:hypothetical protein [Pelagicoccus sp. SDUM812002]|uniref:hypothetical protein n=1 Tax=Pelagicoccus sp. SDUM812002 TaxID=3041266 RepID=UPI00280ECAF3|nr:hypothetical protein [Pelagicoccus sp. SDUM812002]MDQ8187504.1 hypothetical protein [Pelagicoccus sp. SDUM812002]